MLKYLIIAATFLAITLGVLLLRTGDDPSLYNNAVFVSATEIIDAPTNTASQPTMIVPTPSRPVSSATRPPRRIIGSGTQVAIAVTTGTQQDVSSQDDLLRTITSGAFAGMASVTPTTAPATVQPNGTAAEPDALQAMIIQSLRTGGETQPNSIPNTASANAAQSTPSPIQVLEATTYVVRSGDSLGTIAAQYYGRKEDYYRIFEANRSRLSSPDSIRVGQKLLVPKS